MMIRGNADDPKDNGSLSDDDVKMRINKTEVPHYADSNKDRDNEENEDSAAETAD